MGELILQNITVKKGLWQFFLRTVFKLSDSCIQANALLAKI